MRFLRVFVLLPVLLLAPAAHGQPTDTTALPEIAPREIEIRSEREIALPALERQPLTGFVQAPTVPTVPADRAPYVGTNTYPLDSLPESLPLPTPSFRTVRPPAPPTQGSLEGGTGRSFSRFFEGRLQHPLSAATRLSVHGAYRGTEADRDDDVAEARLQLRHSSESVGVDGALYGRAQRYALHGARPQAADSLGTPRREGTLAGGSVGVHTNGSVPASATAQYEHASYTSSLGRDVPERTFTQQQFVLRGNATLPVWLRPRLDATYRRSWLGGDPARETAFDLHAAGTLSIIDRAAATLDLGVATLAYGTPAAPTRPSIGTADATYVAPVVRAEWRVSDAVRLYAHTQPQLGASSLEALSATNPYTQYAPSLRPSLETTHADAGLTYTPGPVRVVAEAGYRYAPTYRYFAQADPDALFDVRYDAARILQGRAEVALQGRRGVQASLSMTIRDARLPALDADVPNVAPVTADAMVAVSVADGDGTLTAHGHVAAPRDTRLGPAAPQLDAVWSIDLEAAYAVAPRIDLLARAHNVSNEAPVRWAGYPRPPAQFSAGLRLHW
jgi:hypothetical protein